MGGTVQVWRSRTLADRGPGGWGGAGGRRGARPSAVGKEGLHDGRVLQAIWRPLGEASADPDLAKLEAELLEGINLTGFGPMGLGGDTTALAVMVEAA